MRNALVEPLSRLWHRQSPLCSLKHLLHLGPLLLINPLHLSLQQLLQILLKPHKPHLRIQVLTRHITQEPRILGRIISPDTPRIRILVHNQLEDARLVRVRVTGHLLLGAGDVAFELRGRLVGFRDVFAGDAGHGIPDLVLRPELVVDEDVPILRPFVVDEFGEVAADVSQVRQRAGDFACTGDCDQGYEAVGV